MVSALPAFVVSIVIAKGLGHLGMSQIWSFMIFAPIFIFAWYYFIGWLIDRWILKRPQQA